MTMTNRSVTDGEAVRNGDMKYFYEQGYNTGTEWLNPNRRYAYNFKHPSVKGGYIPGGPSLGIYVRRAEKGYGNNESDNRNAIEGHRQWIKGFIDGINQYVKDNNLDFPMVEG